MVIFTWDGIYKLQIMTFYIYLTFYVTVSTFYVIIMIYKSKFFSYAVPNSSIQHCR